MSNRSVVRLEKLMAFVATRDPSKAKAFYRDLLGLELISEDPFALVFSVGGTMLRVTTVEKLNPAPQTVLGWDVPDIMNAVQSLHEKGINFERYPGVAQDALGIWNSPSGAKVAWFKDPDGNTLSLTQF